MSTSQDTGEQYRIVGRRGWGENCGDGGEQKTRTPTPMRMVRGSAQAVGQPFKRGTRYLSPGALYDTDIAVDMETGDIQTPQEVGAW